MQDCIFFDFSYQNICVIQKKAVILHAFSLVEKEKLDKLVRLV